MQRIIGKDGKVRALADFDAAHLIVDAQGKR